MNDPWQSGPQDGGEGVIRFRYALRPPRDAAPTAAFAAIHARGLRDGWLGRDPARYEGLAYGNLSRATEDGFWVTASQRIDRTTLAAEDLVHLALPIEGGVIDARGDHPPSSEALTHAAVHLSARAAARDAGACRRLAVVHGHAPALWHRAQDLGWDTTTDTAGNGTRQLADEVAHCVTRSPDAGALVMRGHEDGILLWGPSFGEISERLDALPPLLK